MAHRFLIWINKWRAFLISINMGNVCFSLRWHWLGVPWTIIWKSSACWLCLRERARPWVLFVVSLYCSNSPATSLPTIALATCICLQPCLPVPKESHLDSGESQGPDPLCHPGGPSVHCLEGSTLSTTILGSILDISLHSASVHHLLLRNSSSWTRRLRVMQQSRNQSCLPGSVSLGTSGKVIAPLPAPDCFNHPPRAF